MSLSDALKLAELREDLENLNLDLFSESIDGITGFANALDRVANSWARLGKEDMSAFQTVVALINAMGDTIGGAVKAWENYNNVKEMISQRENARASLKVANDAMEATSEASKSATVVASSAAVTASKATANTAAAATGAASSVAGIPIVGAVMAVAAVASVLGALSNLPKFAKGGIVGGSSRSGDNNLVRVNSGEMIMTTAQQSELWNAIKTGDFGSSGGDVKFKIDGTSLVGVLNNHNRKISRR